MIVTYVCNPAVNTSTVFGGLYGTNRAIHSIVHLAVSGAVAIPRASKLRICKNRVYYCISSLALGKGNNY